MLSAFEKKKNTKTVQNHMISETKTIANYINLLTVTKRLENSLV